MAKPLMYFAVSGSPPEENVSNTNTDQTKGSNSETHNSATVEGDFKGASLTVSAGSFRGSDVCTGCSLHPNKTTDHGADRTTEIGECSLKAHGNKNQDENDNDEDSKNAIFAAKESHCSLVNVFGNLTHGVISDRLRLNHIVKDKRDNKSDYPENRSPHLQLHLFSASLFFLS